MRRIKRFLRDNSWVFIGIIDIAMLLMFFLHDLWVDAGYSRILRFYEDIRGLTTACIFCTKIRGKEKKNVQG